MERIKKTVLYNNGNNLVQQLQESYASLSKIFDTADLINLKDSVKDIILEENHNKTEIDLAFKIYFQTHAKLKCLEKEFLENFDGLSLTLQPFILNACLFTDYYKFADEQFFKEKCNETLEKSVSQNSKNLIIILKAINLFHKRFSHSKIQVSLQNIYFCLQNNNGIRTRDEALQVLKSNIQNSLQRTSEICFITLNNIPWTNKNKFYILSAVFEVHPIEVVKDLVTFDMENFWDGVRLSLAYKHLYSAGQYLLKSLSTSNELVHLILGVLKTGSEQELINLNYQWWSKVECKQEIFETLENAGAFKTNLLATKSSFRDIITTYLFRMNLLKSQENVFYETILFVIKNFKNFDDKSQLFAYKFVVESLSNFNSFPIQTQQSQIDLNDILDFLLEFLKAIIHKTIPEFRQNTLEKIPAIINFVAKQYCNNIKVDLIESNAVLDSAKNFFICIKNIYEYGISCTEYAPIVFGVKLISVTLKVLFSKNRKNISKNCNILQNEKFANFLKDKNVFDFKLIQEQLLTLLKNESVEYDDVQHLCIKTIQFLQDESSDFESISMECKDRFNSPDFVKCSTASVFATLIADCNLPSEGLIMKLELFDFCWIKLNFALQKFEEDPFSMCKKGYHLFGFIACLNKFHSNERQADLKNLEKSVDMCLTVNQIVLRLLNVANKNIDSNASASFEIMDESLEMLITKSQLESTDSIKDRKYLLLSFWTTLKVTCELATTIGSNLVNSSINEDEQCKIRIYEKCLDINVNVLNRCRHKGAIEAAGVELGTLVRQTSLAKRSEPFYELLFKCFDVLFGNVSKNSLTRRGAGLSIMFHHLLKNDMHSSKLLCHHAIKTLLIHAQKTETPIDKIVSKSENTENFDALILHYMCVLVKDTELKEFVAEYYDDIMIAAVKRIEHREWCVRNAALQLFGGITPKIVGQKQTGNEDILEYWEPTEITLKEILIKLPKTLLYMLEYCKDEKIARNLQKSNSTIILFLEFLSKIEHLKLDFSYPNQCVIPTFLMQCREIFWKFLSHRCEKIRKLSAYCMMRFHDCSDEISNLILILIKIFYSTHEPNFEHGLIFCVFDGVKKMLKEKFLHKSFENYLQTLRSCFEENYVNKNIGFHNRIMLLDLFVLLKFDLHSEIVIDSIFGNRKCFEQVIKHNISLYSQTQMPISYNLWCKKIEQIYNINALQN